MRSDLRQWLKLNFKQISASSLVSFISASVSGVSLVLVQGVFGKEKNGTATDLARRAIDFLGEDRAILLAIAIWGVATYFLNNFNERLTSIRLDAKKLERTSQNIKINAKERRILTNESNFFESFISFTNHIIRLAVFAIVLLNISPALVKIDVVIAIGYLFVVCKKRFQEGLRVGEQDRHLRREMKQKRREKDFAPVFDLFIERSWLSARLSKGHFLVFVLLIIGPFVLSDAFSLGLLNHIALFNFTTLLIFFSNAVHLAIHSASIGFRFSAAFSDVDAEEEE